MKAFSLDFEWVDALKAQGPELSATWANLTLNIDDGYPTRVFDESAKSVRNHTIIPLYPLAEWIVENWWYIFNEKYAPKKSAEFASRHSIKGIRDGFSFPDISFIPFDDHVSVAWQRYNPSFSSIQYLSSGSSYLSKENLRSELSEFVSAVTNRLEDLGLFGTFLQEEWAYIQSISCDERKFCDFVSSFGADPLSLSDMDAAIAEKVYDDFVGPYAEVISGLELAEADEFRDYIEQFRSIIRRNSFDMSGVCEIRKMVSQNLLHREQPWWEGYDLAHLCNISLNLDPLKLKDIETLGGAFSLPLHNADSLFASRNFGVFDGIFDEHDGRMGIGVRRAGPKNVKFHLARVLCDILWHNNKNSSIISSVFTRNQQRNRAFAAELLAPASWLRKNVGGDFVSYERIVDISEDLHVSEKIVEHQIQNHNIAQIVRDDE